MEEIKDKKDLLLNSLKKFYKEQGNKELILPIIKQQTSISLRLLDWLVTNYAKQNDIHYNLNLPTGSKNFNIWLDYKNQLKAYNKLHFDPFSRRNRIYYFLETNETIDISKDEIKTYQNRNDGFVTTVGQLNFFRWALIHRVIDYAFDNLKDIESDMLMSSDSRKLNKQKGKRKKEFSYNINKSINKHDIKIVIQFP